MSEVKQRVLAAETPQFIDQPVVLKGWVHVRRDHGKLIFIDLIDRSGMVQLIINQQVSSEAYQAAGELRSQDVVEIKGIVHKRPEKLVNQKLASGTVEVEVTDINLLSKAETLPFDMGGEELNLELPTLLDYRSLTLRHPKVKAIFLVQDAILGGFRKAAKKLDCVEIVVPTIAASSTEGGAEVFSVDYYGHKAFMTQSPQLYKQMMVPIFERVWTIAHAYRAEPSVTTRHLAETTQMDCELGFVEFDQLLDALEQVAFDMVQYAERSCEKIFKEYNLSPVVYGKIPRLTIKEAQEIIYKEYGRDNRQEPDLTPQDEVDICQWANSKHGSDFVTITRFPLKKKPFYTMPDPKNPELSLSYDLLFRGVEVLSGSQRVHDYNQLKQAIIDRGMDPKHFSIYLQAFKYGMPPEGGFSFGLERMTMKLFGVSNIREASLYPRDMERVDARFSTLEEKPAAKK